MKKIIKIALLLTAALFLTGCLDEEMGLNLFKTNFSGTFVTEENFNNSPLHYSSSQNNLLSMDKINSINIHVGDFKIPVKPENFNSETGEFEAEAGFNYSDLELVSIGDKSLAEVLIGGNKFNLSEIDLDDNLTSQLIRVEMFDDKNRALGNIVLPPGLIKPAATEFPDIVLIDAENEIEYFFIDESGNNILGENKKVKAVNNLSSVKHDIDFIMKNENLYQNMGVVNFAK
ncbi:MAG: hypothetical protein ACQESP_01315 [Candidatus Muiribacteriota bacterium]